MWRVRVQGDRILVARVFENLSAALRGEPGSSPEELRASFSVDMFDWKPVQVRFMALVS